MAAGAHAQVDVRLGQLQLLEKDAFDMLLQQRPVAVVLAGVDQELLELLWVLRHLPPPWPPKVGGNGGRGGFHEVGAGADHVEDFHRHELHLYLLATNCTNFH